MAEVLISAPLSCTSVCHTAFEEADCSESWRGGGLSLCQRESDWRKIFITLTACEYVRVYVRWDHRDPFKLSLISHEPVWKRHSNWLNLHGSLNHAKASSPVELVSPSAPQTWRAHGGDPLRVRGQDKAWRAPICLGITVSPSLSHWQPCAWGMCSLHFNYWICPCLQAAGCHCLSISAYPSTLCFTQAYRTTVWLYGLLWPVNGCTLLLFAI